MATPLQAVMPGGIVMVSREVEALILRLYHVEKWPVGTIAREVDVHHSVVRRVLAHNGVSDGLTFIRPSMADPFMPFIVATLKRYPRLSSRRLWEMVQERGYRGGPDHFRRVVARHRPRPAAEAFLKLDTLPAEQAQVDWGHFGYLQVGSAARRLAAFVMVLSWSRMLFVRFYLDQRLENFMRGHQAAFAVLGGVPRVCLYDNLKSVVLERVGDAIRFHPTFLRFAGHHRFEPRPVAVGRGNEKGRVERAIRYVRSSFFEARAVRDLEGLNQQAQHWCEQIATQRPCPADKTLTVRQAHEQERPKLMPLPDDPFPTEERLEVHVRKSPYVRFDLNDYSVPHDRVRRVLTVLATPSQVRLLDRTEVVATHPRTYDKGQRVENPAHIEALVATKKRAREHRAIDRLRHEVPNSRELLCRLAEQGRNLGSMTVALTRLLDSYGAQALDEAIAEAIEKGSPHPHSVRHILDRRHRQRGLPPPLPVRTGLRTDYSVKPHSLDSYDKLQEETDDDDDDGQP